jgi:exosortase
MTKSKDLASSSTRSRWRLYSLWLLALGVLYWHPLREVITYSFHNDSSSYILLIPFISACVIWFERDAIFRDVSTDVSTDLFAAGCCATGAALFVAIPLLNIGSLSQLGSLTFYVLSMLLLAVAGFAVFFGRTAVRNARFSLLFLFLAVPLPAPLLLQVVHFLQKGSAEIAAGLFRLSGVPYAREGMIFDFGSLSIVVAEECSGIRSSIAILILALLAAHFCLRSFWKQTAFVVSAIFVMILKNGIRIATLTLLALFVNPSFLFGRLHHQGGVVFFLIGLLVMFPILALLRRIGASQIRSHAIADGGPNARQLSSATREFQGL